MNSRLERKKKMPKKCASAAFSTGWGFGAASA
jgi:hypothetical protein